MSSTAHSDHTHHVTPSTTLLRTFIALLGLMVLTIGASLLPQLMPGNPIFESSWVMNSIALGIALFKAGLVVQIFMGVKWGTNLTKMFAYGGFIWFTTLFITMIDYQSRNLEPVKGWEPAAPSALPRFKDSGDSLEGSDPFDKLKPPKADQAEGK